MSDVPRPQILSGTTPGPWHVNANVAGNGNSLVVRDAKEDEVADATYRLPDGLKISQANARLIASAPDLAVLLAEAVEILENWAMAFPDEPAPTTAEFKRRAERALGGGK